MGFCLCDFIVMLGLTELSNFGTESTDLYKLSGEKYIATIAYFY